MSKIIEIEDCICKNNIFQKAYLLLQQNTYQRQHQTGPTQLLGGQSKRQEKRAHLIPARLISSPLIYIDHFPYCVMLSDYHIFFKIKRSV